MKTIYVFLLVLVLIVSHACELFLPFPDNDELKLEALILNAPLNQSVVTLNSSRNVNFMWADIDENKKYSVEYELYLSENTRPGLYKSQISNNDYSVILDKNKTYYWKVVAKSNDKISESEVWSLTTN